MGRGRTGAVIGITSACATAVVACSAYFGEEDTPAPDRDPRAEDAGADGTVAIGEVDAAVDVDLGSYGAFKDLARWKTFDLLNAGLPTAYRGAIYDKRYVYFLPSPWSARVARYDPQLPFDDKASWTVFDIGASIQPINPNRGFAGGAFDGRYIYLPPARQAFGNTMPDLVRYDTTLPFSDASSWTKFAVSPAPDRSFAGATFDGTFIYLVPNLEPNQTGQKTIVRYDTRAPFADPASWSLANVSGFYGGAVFDGRWVTFVPGRPWEFQQQTAPQARFSRYDTTMPWNSADSWQHIGAFYELAGGQANVGWSSAIWDGKYVFAIGEVGPMLRFDPKDPFIALSWAQMRGTGANGLFSMASGAYDGRFLYGIPAFRSATNSQAGWIVRYDTTLPFEETTSWSPFDLKALWPEQGDGTWAHFYGAAFDGKYMYFAPADDTTNGGLTGRRAVRFEVRDPPALPPTYRGSWL